MLTKQARQGEKKLQEVVEIIFPGPLGKVQQVPDCQAQRRACTTHARVARKCYRCNAVLCYRTLLGTGTPVEDRLQPGA